jgi:signal transduction histidine kinase
MTVKQDDGASDDGTATIHPLDRSRTRRSADPPGQAERGRALRDLCDYVTDRMAVAVMELQAADSPAASRSAASDAVAHLDSALAELADAISMTREVVADIEDADTDVVARRVRDVAREAAVPLGFHPLVHLDGVRDLDDHVVLHLLAALREALANVSGNTRASRVDVHVGVDAEGVLALRVVDDGLSVDGGARRDSGLRNLAARAQALGGQFTVLPLSTSGTVLVWEVPT